MTSAFLCGVLCSGMSASPHGGHLMPKGHLSDGVLGDEKLRVTLESGWVPH